MASPNKLKKIKSVHSNDGRVAIIMRTKDRPILLPRAFASVLGQTYGNWHLYIINDGGEREPLEKMINRYEGKFAHRITVIHHSSSKGMEAASNTALSRAEGEFLIVHDDDDSWHPHFLEKTVGFLKNPLNGAFAAVTTNIYVIKEEIKDGRVIELERQEWSLWQPDIDFSRMLIGNSVAPISLLIRKSVSDEVGEFDRTTSVLGDWDYNIRILMFGDIGTISEHLAYYHNRITTADDIYGNTTVTENGLKLHRSIDVSYRNGKLRRALIANPEMMGVLQALGRQMNTIENGLLTNLHNQNLSLSRIEESIVRVEKAVSDIQSLIHKTLGPARWVWGITSSVRKLITKSSKKI